MTALAARPATFGFVLLALGACEEVPRTYSTREAPTVHAGAVIYENDFSEPLGPEWNATGRGGKVVDGSLRLARLRNHPLWLDKPLPDDLRIEFDAWAETAEGDIKVELAGDGQSFATEASYTATGYVVILGGWDNSLDVIARRNEHGDDRLAEESLGVEAGRRYHFVLTRRAGELRWEIDGKLVMTYEDPDPLVGPGQDRFAFNDWMAPVRFDNLRIVALDP